MPDEGLLARIVVALQILGIRDKKGDVYVSSGGSSGGAALPITVGTGDYLVSVTADGVVMRPGTSYARYLGMDDTGHLKVSDLLSVPDTYPSDDLYPATDLYP